ncbi:hypothetical protein EDB87DRAFT_1578547 [Lactarius vividus]|nr:hypothetical protein EDB87DRAFT_1578547 [Lactarius vividus]
MHSHKTLAFLALAASTASPALSAPVLEGQQQARASAGAAGGGLGSIIKTVGSGLAFGALPTVLQDVLGGNSTRRALARDLLVRRIFDTPTTNVFNGTVKGLPVNSNDLGPPTSTDITFGKPPPTPSGIDARAPDDFPFPLVGGVFPDGVVQPNTVPGTSRRDVAIDNFLSDVKSVGDFISNILPGRDIDERALLDGLNNFQTTDAIGNPLKFGIISGSVPGTRRDVAIDNFLSGVQNIGDFINNILPGRDIDERSLFSFVNDPLRVGTGSVSGTRREPSPALSLGDLSGIGKTILGTGASLAAADAVKGLFGQDDTTSSTTRDLNEALQLVIRQLNELD